MALLARVVSDSSGAAVSCLFNRRGFAKTGVGRPQSDMDPRSLRSGNPLGIVRPFPL
jgi:hypothetical protein